MPAATPSIPADRLLRALRAAHETLDRRHAATATDPMWEGSALPGQMRTELPRLIQAAEQVAATPGAGTDVLALAVSDGRLFRIHAALAASAQRCGEAVEDAAHRAIADVFIAREGPAHVDLTAPRGTGRDRARTR